MWYRDANMEVATCSTAMGNWRMRLHQISHNWALHLCRISATAHKHCEAILLLGFHQTAKRGMQFGNTHALQTLTHDTCHEVPGLVRGTRWHKESAQQPQGLTLGTKRAVNSRTTLKTTAAHHIGCNVGTCQTLQTGHLGSR